MQTVQIRIPQNLIKKADDMIKKGLFRSRSHLLREALNNYLSNLDHIGMTPYIIGPFTPEEIVKLKNTPIQELQIQEEEYSEINKKLKELEI